VAEEISHIGVVKAVGQKETIVEITSNSACGQCRASSLCSVAESAKKEVTVASDPDGRFSVGDEVEVVLLRTLGDRAVWVSYVIPLGILMIIVVSLSYTGLSELVTGLLGMAALGVYFLVVWLLRDRISRGYVFGIRRKETLNQP